MSKRALVLGSQVEGLSGVHNDVESMTRLLEGHGFEIDKRIEGDATRAGILEGYDRLIGCSGPADAAVIYYSGHGARAANPSSDGPRHLQCIVPTDWGRDGFRGILDVELSARLAQLTEVTRNVTVIFDCCHAARMIRGGEPSELLPRSIPRIWADGVDAFLKANPVDVSDIHAVSNPHAVRLVATEADRSAFETDLLVDGVHRRMGLLTHAFGRALGEVAELPVSWRSLCMRVRELVMQAVPGQRPHVAGPSERLLFLTTEVKRADAVVFFFQDGQPALRASKLTGAYVGAKYDIAPLGRIDLAEDEIVASATVTKLSGANALVSLEPREGRPKPVAGALAFPRELPFKKAAVRISGNPAPVAALRNELVGDKYVELVDDESPAMLDVIWRDDEVLIVDRDEVVVQRRRPTGDEDVATRNQVLSALRGWSRAESLRTLEDGGLPASAAHVEWGRVEDGTPVPMEDGDALHVGDRLYVTVENRSQQDLFVAIFDIGIAGTVTLLSKADPHGRKVEPGARNRYALGEDFGVLQGLEAAWNASVPDDGPRRESIVVLVCEERHAFESFETQQQGQLRGGLRTSLEQRLGAVRQGGVRDFSGETAGGRYHAHVIHFDLHPTARSEFLIDRAMSPAELRWPEAAPGVVAKAAAAGKPPKGVSIRLDEVLIHDVRTLWGGATVRVDTLAVTGAATRPETFHARTEYFPDVKDGDILSLKDMLIFQGRVTRYLNFGIWVSRDESKEPKPLDELLVGAIDDKKLQGALATLIALSAAAPPAGVVVAAGSAAATVLSVASNVIRAVTSKHIGLYRQSFLPAEQFGVGVHPEGGDLIRAQEFSFRFRIDPM